MKNDFVCPFDQYFALVEENIPKLLRVVKKCQNSTVRTDDAINSYWANGMRVLLKMLHNFLDNFDLEGH